MGCTGRGRSVSIDSPAVDWARVIIIEHPGPPQELTVPTQDGSTSVIALLRRDWEFLFNQLRSTHAVVGYLHPVAASAPVLGGEPERYYELAAADAEAVPGAVDPSWTRRGGQPHSVPLLPAAPAVSDDDEAHTMVRIMVEDVATSPTGPAEREAWQRIGGLPRQFAGRVPHGPGPFPPRRPGHRHRGRRGHHGMADAYLHCRARLGPARLRRLLPLTDHTRAAFSAWLQLRHHEHGEHSDLVDLRSVCVLLTLRTDGYRDWDTTVVAVSGNPGGVFNARTC
ncbi:hypothetical protein [Streptomyces vastus]|uniref:Uncharacterized protein n=1 Tax=Streptomyces vastus TaxID=285451 RepID=A0ABN3RWD3_9ACTN